MRKKDLLQFITDGKPIEQIPCGFWIHFSPDKYYGQAAVDAHVRYYEETGVPITKMMNEHLYRIGRKIERPKDWLAIKAENIEDSHYKDFLSEIHAFRKRMGEDVLILATIHGILVSACHATDGPGRFTDPDNTVTRHLKEDPETVAVGLEEIAATLQRLSLSCIEAGADGIYYAALGGEKHRFTEELFTRYVKPIETELLSKVIKKGLVFLHICKSNPRLPMYAGYPGQVVNWAEHNSSYSLSDGANIFPDKIIMGGFDNRSGTILTGTEDEIYEEMKGVIKKVNKDRLIIGADCTLPETTPTDQIHIAVKASVRISVDMLNK